MESSVFFADYSETYVDGRFFARFLLTKFHDNILYYFSLMGPDQISSYKEFMLDRLAGTLPDPLLRLFGIALDKKDLVVSNGDYVIYLVDGWGLGGFKTGSLVAEVYGMFGWLLYPFVMMASALLLFVFHDAFVMVTKHRRLAFSPLILLLIWNLVGTTAAFGLGRRIGHCGTGGHRPRPAAKRAVLSAGAARLAGAGPRHRTALKSLSAVRAAPSAVRPPSAAAPAPASRAVRRPAPCCRAARPRPH